MSVFVHLCHITNSVEPKKKIEMSSDTSWGAVNLIANSVTFSIPNSQLHTKKNRRKNLKQCMQIEGWIGCWEHEQRRSKMEARADSPAGGGEAVGRRVAVELPGPGGGRDGLGGELAAAAEAGVRRRVADAERDEALALAGAGEQPAHHAPDGDPVLRERRVAPHRHRPADADAIGLAALLLLLLRPCRRLTTETNKKR